MKPVYHRETGVRMLREQSQSHLTIVKNLSRVMNRLRAVLEERLRNFLTAFASHYGPHLCNEAAVGS